MSLVRNMKRSSEIFNIEMHLYALVKMLGLNNLAATTLKNKKINARVKFVICLQIAFDYRNAFKI